MTLALSIMLTLLVAEPLEKNVHQTPLAQAL